MKRKNGDEIYFFYDGDKMTAEFNSQGSLLRAYRYGPQVLWMEEGGNIFFLHTDGQGSVRAVTNIQGQIVAEYSYDAFGNQLEGEEGWNPFKYCGIFGYIKDEEINLMKVGASFYDPEIGRWIQKDPILPGVNWWVYCENDPVNGVDPSGKILEPLEWVKIALLNPYVAITLGVAAVAVVVWVTVSIHRTHSDVYEERENWLQSPPSYQYPSQRGGMPPGHPWGRYLDKKCPTWNNDR